MIRYILNLIIILTCLQTTTSIAQTKKIRDELRRAKNYEESKKFDTYHVYEKYLTNQQRFELNMYYVGLHVKIPNENKNNFWLYNSAKDGNTCAQINLAYSYKIGRIVNKDSNNCRKWLLQAIKSKSDLAYYYYGLCCMDNTFDKEVCDSAIFYLKEADKRKIADASLALTFAYKYGIHTEKNDNDANYYFNKYKEVLKQTKTDFALSNAILIPNGFNLASLLSIQLREQIIELSKDSQLVVTIKTNGNSSYLTQQLSWDKASSLRHYLISHGINPDRICIWYGGQLNTSIVELLIARRDGEFVNVYPPPPVPNYERTIFLECENNTE